MPTENRSREVLPEARTGEHSFDELAKGLAADTLTRGRILKLVGAAFLGGVISATFPGVAQARRRRHRSACLFCDPASPTCPSGCCQTITTGIGCCVSSCPSGQACVNGTCCPSGRACPNACCPPNQCCGTDGNCCPPGNNCCSSISAQLCCPAEPNAAGQGCCLLGCLCHPG